MTIKYILKSTHSKKKKIINNKILYNVLFDIGKSELQIS